MISVMAAARQQSGNSLDRFLIRAIIALASLMIGVLAGFSLAVFYPKPTEPSERAPVDCEPIAATSEKPIAEPPQPVADPPKVEGPSESEGEGDGTGEETGDDTGEETGEPAPIPEVAGEPTPISGNLIVEIREISGDSRSKAQIRQVAKRGAHQMEACILSIAPELPQVRVHHQLYIEPSGKVAGKLLLPGGTNPDIDACVGKALAGWNFGATDQTSFFKLKLIWTP
jgi:hypothetical protein